MGNPIWVRLGSVGDLGGSELQSIRIEGRIVALSFRDGRFAAIAGTCPHVGGPLGEGSLEGDDIVCPWQSRKFDRLTGRDASGGGEDAAVYPLKEEGGELFIDISETPDAGQAREEHPLAREPNREEGAIRLAGISATHMNAEFPRFSTSEYLLEEALRYAETGLAVEARMIRLRDLSFRTCEGYYSRSAEACVWPCTITRADPDDQMAQVYEAVVHWADALIVATPIRWGAASSLYFKMAERMNCIQNQVTIADRVLIRDKVSGFIITGGQDNVQGVAGQMLTFFAELGFQFPQFPFVAHSRGWASEDMERNVSMVRDSEDLKEGARALAGRCVEMARRLIERGHPAGVVEKGGRKAQPV